MRRSKIAHALFGSGLFLSVLAAAQSPEPPPCGAEPGAPRCDPTSGTTATLATVGGKPLTLEELDPKDRERIAALEAEIARGRREALDDAINERLLQIEARKRRQTADQLYYSEIMKQIVPATEEQIHAEYAAHPDTQGSSEKSLRD